MTSQRCSRSLEVGTFVISLAIFCYIDVASGMKAQVFREKPKSVEVREGEDVFLKCAVDHQQGNAQWTKDGFALGFERHVPGYPRFSYAGEPSLGEHHLVIKGVTLQDDGEYQCQVGPTTKSAPIWAAATVTVMVSPSSINLKGRGDGIVKVQAGSTFTLECLVSDARPAPSVSWFRGDQLIDKASQEDKVVSSSLPRLWSVESKLVLKAVREDDDQRYSCRALHPALQGENRVLETSVTLSVLHPPNAPVISGYSTGEILVAGERRTLTCRVAGGNPRPWVSWYWHGYDMNRTSRTRERTSVILQGKTLKGSKGSRSVSVVQELTASRSEDGAVYECRVSNELLRKPLTTNVTVTVQYPPTSVSVTGPSVVIEGKQFSLTCSTTPANPPATIAWYLDGMPADSPESEMTEDDVGGWVTSSHLTQYAGKALEVREVKAKCMAFHSVTKTPVTGTKVISIIRAPGSPQLETDNRGQVVAGTVVEFACTTIGGYPTPQIRLHKGDQELKADVQQHGNVTRASVAFKVRPEDNGVKVQCEVTNAATTSPLSTDKVIRLLFPPSRVIGRASPSNVEAGKVALLTCEASASVPPSTITWRSGGASLEGANTHQAPGEFEGTVTRSELEVRPRGEDNGRVFTCEADNGLGASVATNITLGVLHGPVWIAAPSSRIDVKEGQDLVVTSIAAANPGPVSYTWRGGDAVLAGHGNGGGELRLRTLHRQQSGNYSVTAYSPKGNLTSSFYVNVQYAPESITAEEKVIVDPTERVTLTCSAVGNPTPTMVWTRDPPDPKSAVLASGVGKVRLDITSVTVADTGRYLCQASNAVTSAKPHITILIVKQSPSPMNNPNNINGGSWAIVGGNGRLECRVRAAPQPTFRWSTQGGMSLKSGGRYTIMKPKITNGVAEWTSVLEIAGVTDQDYGVYTCTATNTLGIHSTSLALIRPVPPLAPTLLTVNNVTTESVLLLWSRADSNRDVSGYTIRYWSSGDDEYQYMDVGNGNETMATVRGLVPATDYFFTVQAYSEQGRSSYATPPIEATTLGHVSASSSTEGGAKSRVPRLILLIMTLAGTALLALNMAIIACFVRRRSAHRGRGVSASSSKTTTLEVFSPATTPGATQGDDLPLTSTTQLPPAGYQKVECQTSIDDLERVSLSGRDVSGNQPLLSTQETSAFPVSVAPASKIGGLGHQKERFLAQNGGLYWQKHADDSPYYYSPIPQSNYAPTDSPAFGHPGSPPDVCPTPPKHQQLQQAEQLRQEDMQQQKEAVLQRGPSQTDDQVSLSSYTSSHSNQTTRVASPATTQVALQPETVLFQRQSSLPEQSKLPQHRQRHHNHRQPPQQVPQQQPMPYYSWSPQGQEHVSQQKLLQQQPGAHPCVQKPDLYTMFPDRPGLDLGYATIGPRGNRSTPMKFSTLQRTRPSSSSSTSSSTPVAAPAPHPLSPLSHPVSQHQGNHEYANTHYATAHNAQGYSSTLTRDGTNAHKLARRPSYDQAPHVHGGQEDSGSSGYGGSPRQEMVPGKMVAHGTSVAVAGGPTDAGAHASENSTSTLRRQRSIREADKKVVPDAAQMPVREIVNGSGGTKYS